MGRLALLFCALLVCGCQKEVKAPQKSLRVAATSGPQSLDPRSARTLVDATVLNMLYEGLFCYTPSGALVPGVATDVTISPDLTTYTFHLRNSHWSNGDPVVAQDFITCWKNQLQPGIPAPNAFLFYDIKNARAAKAGMAPISSIGIHAPDEQTLVVQLEQPTPYFLELTAFYAFFPVNPHAEEERLPANGPFHLIRYSPNSELITEKNPYYWDSSHVSLAGVNITIINEHTALSLFEMGELDWAGSPLSTIPNDAMQSFAQDKRLTTVPAAATHWLRFNIDHPSLNNVKLRKALTLALNRQELISHVIRGNQTPAMSVVPPSRQWKAHAFFNDGDIKMAKQLLAEALDEMPHQPVLTLLFGPNERDRQLAQAIQQQWYTHLGIWVELQSVETKLLFEKLKAQDYHIANGSWFADFDDPLNFLSVFEAKDNGTNHTGWENIKYKDLLRLSSLEADPAQRQHLLHEAESLLIADMPVTPLFFYSLNYLQTSEAQAVGVTPLGIQIFHARE